MSDSVLLTNDVVFDSIEHLNMFSSVEVKLPDNIPDDCNLVCYRVKNYEMLFSALYKETNEGLFNLFQGEWNLSSNSLEAEIEFDNYRPFKYIYVRVNQKTKGVFTPQCLIGVETNYGYIDAVRQVYLTPLHTKPITFVHTNDNLYFTEATKLKYYISDESDETASYAEYIDTFYDGCDIK